jgi:hypothetical protein
MLGDELSPPGFGDLMVERAALLLQEYQEVNAHLRANTSQFVNWFSFFLTLSLLMAGVFATTPYRPALVPTIGRARVMIQGWDAMHPRSDRDYLDGGGTPAA